MAILNRDLKGRLERHYKDKKALIILGPRQSGKTTLIHEIMKDVEKPYQLWNGDDFQVRSSLQNISIASLKRLTGESGFLFIDEAQRIENIGLVIKMIVDNVPGVKVIATGSSSFELSKSVKEPMTGRKWEYLLLPFSFHELCNYHSSMTEEGLIEQRMVYGYYPEVVMSKGNEINLLKSLADSYLYKDLLVWERILKPDRLEKLVQALAFQIGNEVSYNELGQIAGLDNQTVERYIDILEKAFIVFRLKSLSRNLRNELKKSRKIYFYDNGIRNAVINSFNPLDLRNDVGSLWENFLISERIKYRQAKGRMCNIFFWRNTNQQEIDYIEERDGKFFAYEFKWQKRGNTRIPGAFLSAYPESQTNIISRDNYADFISNDQ